MAAVRHNRVLLRALTKTPLEFAGRISLRSYNGWDGDISSKSGKHLENIDILENIDSTMRRMETGIKELGTGIKELGTGIKELGTGIKEVGTGIKELGTGIKELGTGIQVLQAQGETSNKILRHLSQSMDQYVRSDVRSTEQEVTLAAHAVAKQMFGELVDDPEFNHLVRDRKTRKKVLELDGYFLLENNAVGIVEAKRHVMQGDVTTLLLKGFTTRKEEGFTDAVLFIGGPVVDNGAKKYAQAEGIYVLEFSGNRYAIKDRGRQRQV